MAITNFRNLADCDLDRPVWRYLTVAKYVSLITYQALWFSKLNILVDQYEGSMPARVDQKMKAEQEKFKRVLRPELHEQLDKMNQRNVDDGRELTVVNCWFMDESESERMWAEYVGSHEGVAIKSTVRRLSQYVLCDPRLTLMGKVEYVDLETHGMSAYEANQAQERAFLKTERYSHEKEIRIATMSLRGPMCVGMDGEPLTSKDYEGVGMNNFDYPGLYIKTDLRHLVQATVIAPGAAKWFESTIRRIVKLSGIGVNVARSSLERA